MLTMDQTPCLVNVDPALVREKQIIPGDMEGLKIRAGTMNNDNRGLHCDRDISLMYGYCGMLSQACGGPGTLTCTAQSIDRPGSGNYLPAAYKPPTCMTNDRCIQFASELKSSDDSSTYLCAWEGFTADRFSPPTSPSSDDF